MALEEGAELTRRFRVAEEHLASSVGSGAVRALSTPSMVAFMEAVALELAQRGLGEGETTVGVSLDVRHVRPAPPGAEVEVTARLLAAEGRRLLFWVEARCCGRRIGYGLHERAVVSREEFERRLGEA